jgi:outer membrane protein OmpA-like peptidoglycan-associated protein
MGGGGGGGGRGWGWAGWGGGWGWGWGAPIGIGYYPYAYPYYAPAYYAPAYYAPAYYPAAYAAPVGVAPAPRQVRAPESRRAFQVFFDFDKSDLTPAAAQVIRQAADEVKAGRATVVTVVGHTDTTGSSPYNQGLSDRRAAAVRRQLIADGVTPDAIDATGVGKGGLLVPTAEGVREAQNRRVEIVLGAPGASASAGSTSAATPAAAPAPRPAAPRTLASNCRNFSRQITIDGQATNAWGTTCQQTDGSWRIVG